MGTKRRPAETYVAFLRGINVGGQHVIKMADLRTWFESAGFRDVVSYIQSGNVIFKASPTKSAVLTAQIEEMLAAAFDHEASVVVRSGKKMRHGIW